MEIQLRRAAERMLRIARTSHEAPDRDILKVRNVKGTGSLQVTTGLVKGDRVRRWVRTKNGPMAKRPGPASPNPDWTKKVLEIKRGRDVFKSPDVLTKKKNPGA